MSPDPPDRAWLISLPGNPRPLNFRLDPGKASGLLLGRAADCDLRLPVGIDEVSKRHARFLRQSGRWLVVDLESRWGTRVNGVVIPPKRPVLVADGDRIYVHPWAFRFSTGPDAPPATTSVDDTGVTHFRALTGTPGEAMGDDLLGLLLEASATLQAAGDERLLAAALVDVARRGCGMDAAVLRATDAEGGVEVLAPEPDGLPNPRRPVRFSRTLLTAAFKGVVAEYPPAAGSDPSRTMVQSHVVSAVCAPLTAGPAVYACLYVQGAKPLGRGASGFCQALARMGGLAMANLQRLEIERRAAGWQAELAIAAVAQSVILPRSRVTAGPFVCQGRSKPGDGYLSGDFFDVQVVGGGRLAVSLGDVMGHGARASILMAFAQGYLRAALAEHGDPVRAATGLNRFVEGRSQQSKFISLWLGLLDPAAMTLTYVDAGHGLAHLIGADGPWRALREHGGALIGIDPDSRYVPATVPLAPGESLLVVSDGIIEQQCPGRGPEDPMAPFGIEGVRAAIHGADRDGRVDRLFDALERAAGGKGLLDDTTALLVHWT